MDQPDPQPDPAARARRRSFTGEKKLALVAEYEAATADERGALLRREAIYTSHISEWRKQRDRGNLSGPRPGSASPPSRSSWRSCGSATESIARCAADALTQMRAVLEHTIFAEVEHLLQRPLEQPQARRIEMPATKNEQGWQRWLARSEKAGLPVLAAGSTLAGRIDTLQPYHWGENAATHPLCVLVEHTNQVKHRTPAIAATRVAKVRLDVGHTEVRVADPDTRRPVEPGMRLVSGPIDFREEVDIWPTVAIRRPHTSMWHPLLAELGALEKWVREDALPRLLGVGKDLGPLPPQLDITQGHQDLRAAARQAGMIPAARRAAVRLGAEAVDVRPALADMLANHWPELGDAVRRWVASLDDSAAVEFFERHANRNPAELAGMLTKLRTEIDDR